MMNDTCPLPDTPPRLSPDDVAEFAELMRVHIGRRLTHEQAEDEATAFLGLVWALIQARSKTTQEISEKFGAGEEVR